MPWMTFVSMTNGVSDGVESLSWWRNENLKIFFWFSSMKFECEVKRFRDDAAQFADMMSRTNVLSVLFFCNFTRLTWLQFLLEIVRDSAVPILKFLTLLLCLQSCLQRTFTSLSSGFSSFLGKKNSILATKNCNIFLL